MTLNRLNLSKSSTSLAVVVIVYFGTRLANLLNMPLFWDEASYIWIAQLIRRTGDWLMPIHPPMGGSYLPPLFMWITSVFLPASSEPALVGRVLSVVFGALGLLGIYLAASKIYGDRVGLIASVLYVVSPFELFYQRKALCDPLLATCGIWTLFFTLELMEGS